MLDNLSFPTSQEEKDAVVSSLKDAITQVILSSLSDGQSIVEVTINSVEEISGTTTLVIFEVTLRDSCNNGCGSATDIATELYNQFKSDLSETIQSGAFVTTLQAEAGENTDAFDNVVVSAPSFDNFTIVSSSPTSSPTHGPTPELAIENWPTHKPTTPPTLRPTNAPTKKNSTFSPNLRPTSPPTSVPTAKPNSAISIHLSHEVFYTISGIVAVYLCF
jgi:hypothetical protein